VTEPRLHLIICGGGLAGCLTALALAERRPDIRFLLLEQERSFGGNHLWSFFDTDLPEDERKWLEPLIHCHWPEHEIRFPRRRRTLPLGYNSIRSTDLDRRARTRLRPDQYRLGCQIQNVGSDHVVAEGTRIEADGVVDARGGALQGNLDLAWQKFVGRTYRFQRSHGLTSPVIMDALVGQEDGYRFIYSLPFSDRELMIEDTYYASNPDLDRTKLGNGLDALASGHSPDFEVVGEETGVLPILLAGEIDALWPDAEPPVARLGMRGGFFHPTTGYSLPDAVRNADLLCEQRDFSSPSLHRLFHKRAGKLWNERRFFQLLNRMLFRAAQPDQRYRVLEHFYRLPVQVIARFYAAELTALDKVRILSGRPPVPIGRAISAMRSKAA
jgi:lycopene beta-cyclase